MDLNSLIGLFISCLIGLSGFAFRQMKSDLDQSLMRIEAAQTVEGVKLDAMADELRLLRARLHENGILPWAM